VYYNKQPIGIVVADSLNAAWHAASLVHVRYQKTAARLSLKAGFKDSYPGHHNEDPGMQVGAMSNGGLAQAEIKVDQILHHPHTTPQSDGTSCGHRALGGRPPYALCIDAKYYGHKQALANIFGIADSNVHVVCLYVGGALAAKGQLWSHVPLGGNGRKKVNRPVKLVLERPQMFGSVGARPQTYQRITLGAAGNGKLTAIRHEVYTNTSFLEDYLESSAVPTRKMYACPNVSTKHRLVQLNLGTPTYTRAPGVATGTYALESPWTSLPTN